MAKVEAGYIVKTPVIVTDARGALGLLKRLSYTEIIRKKDLKRYIRQSLNQAKKRKYRTQQNGRCLMTRENLIWVLRLAFIKKHWVVTYRFLINVQLERKATTLCRKVGEVG